MRSPAREGSTNQRRAARGTRTAAVALDSAGVEIADAGIGFAVVDPNECDPEAATGHGRGGLRSRSQDG